jgi:prepilin-type N-terminal cleavage/methylation domain-containing protein
MFSSKIVKRNQSFTLVEVLISMAIITIGAVGVFFALQGGITQTALSSSRTIAAYLGQEGIEIVRNIRDTNYLEKRYGDPTIRWDNGIPEGNCFEVDYQSEELSRCGADLKNLKFDNSNGYNYLSGENTQFKRKIQINKLDDNEIEIIVTVEWQEREENYNFVLQGNLYNIEKSL